MKLDFSEQSLAELRQYQKRFEREFGHDHVLVKSITAELRERSRLHRKRIDDELLSVVAGGDCSDLV